MVSRERKSCKSKSRTEQNTIMGAVRLKTMVIVEGRKAQTV